MWGVPDSLKGSIPKFYYLGLGGFHFNFLFLISWALFSLQNGALGWKLLDLGGPKRYFFVLINLVKGLKGDGRSRRRCIAPNRQIVN